MAQTSERSQRQRVRLRLLRQWGRRYPKPPATDLPPLRVLVIRPDHLGDLLFTTPALHLLRTRLPDAEITALVGPWSEAVLAGNPDVDQVLTCPFPGFTRQAQGNPLAPYRFLRQEAGRLRALRFDLALVLRFDHWWGAWLAAAADIPQRIGYHVAEVEPFLTQAVPYVRGRHEVVQNLGLALAVWQEPGVMGQVETDAKGQVDLKEARGLPPASSETWHLRFPVRAADDAAAAQVLGNLTAVRPLVAIHPGSGATVKRWRTEAWAELAGELVRRHNVQVVFTGSAGEAALIDPVLHALRQSLPPERLPVSLAGATDLGSLAAVYRRCSLVVGPDSGPLHLAVAVGAPTLHLYGPVDPRTFGPWGSAKRHRVVISNWACIPCNRLDWPDSTLAEHGCVHDIPVDQVLAEAANLLKETGR